MKFSARLFIASFCFLLAAAPALRAWDYAGHRLTFQLFAQSPPYAHLAAVYRNFDWNNTLDFVQQAAGLSDKVMGKMTRSTGDSAVSKWFSTHMPQQAAKDRAAPRN